MTRLDHQRLHFPYCRSKADHQRMGHDGMTDVELADFPDGRHRLYVVVAQAMPGIHHQPQIDPDNGRMPDARQLTLPDVVTLGIGIAPGMQFDHCGTGFVRRLICSSSGSMNSDTRMPLACNCRVKSAIRSK